MLQTNIKAVHQDLNREFPLGFEMMADALFEAILA